MVNEARCLGDNQQDENWVPPKLWAKQEKRKRKQKGSISRVILIKLFLR